MSSPIPVVVDAMWREGIGQIALRLLRDTADPLPSFEPGAFLDLVLPGGLTRPYSIASAPADRDGYVLCIKREELSRGGSLAVHGRVRVGDRLFVSAPRNGFGLLPAVHHVLLAGGIGITPILPMAEALATRGESFELHCYVRTRAHVAFAQRLGATGIMECTSIHVSEEGNSPRARLPPSVRRWPAGARLYQCGPKGLMAAVREAALAGGWPMDRLQGESFGAVRTNESRNETFEVELAGCSRVFRIPPDRTIAQVLVEAGVAVPLSCEIGMCGACLTFVLSGEIDHRDEVTGGTGSEIALCCSRARSGRLVLDM